MLDTRTGKLIKYKLNGGQPEKTVIKEYDDLGVVSDPERSRNGRFKIETFVDGSWVYFVIYDSDTGRIWNVDPRLNKNLITEIIPVPNEMAGEKQ